MKPFYQKSDFVILAVVLILMYAGRISLSTEYAGHGALLCFASSIAVLAIAIIGKFPVWVRLLAILHIPLLLFSLYPLFTQFVEEIETLDEEVQAAEVLPPADVNRELTEKEMGIPRGNYQQYVNMQRNGQVRFQSPRDKPKVLWKKDLNKLMNPEHLLVDRTGAAWFSSGIGAQINLQGRLTRLNPDGTRSWSKRGSADFPTIWPAVVINGGVIVFESVPVGGAPYSYGGVPTGGNMSLDCLDYDGNTIWRTDPVKGKISKDIRVSRVPGNRVIMTNGQLPMKFYTFNISNGELISELLLEKNNHETAPMALDDGWIAYSAYSDRTNTWYSLTRYNQEGTYEWFLDLLGRFDPSPAIINSNGNLIQGSLDAIAEIDKDTGKIIWINKNYQRNRPCGITPLGKIVFAAEDRQGPKLVVVDDQGRELWSRYGPPVSKPIPNVMIYEDGTILYGDRTGLLLCDSKGAFWTMDVNDFRISNYVDEWYIHPAPNDRIIVAFSYSRTSTTPGGVMIASIGYPDITSE